VTGKKRGETSLCPSYRDRAPPNLDAKSRSLSPSDTPKANGKTGLCKSRIQERELTKQQRRNGRDKTGRKGSPEDKLVLIVLSLLCQQLRGGSRAFEARPKSLRAGYGVGAWRDAVIQSGGQGKRHLREDELLSAEESNTGRRGKKKTKLLLWGKS